jgi:lysophospholipase L1-like esterase
MKHVLTALVAFFCISCISNGQKKLVILGSSTSACYSRLPTSLTPEECYVGRLKTFYNQQDPKDTIIASLAVSGSNVYNGMPTNYVYPGADPYDKYKPNTSNNITAALAENPDVIIVNYPSNAYTEKELSIAEIMFAFRTIRNTAAQSNVPCYITTTQPRHNAPDYSTSKQKRKMADLKDSILEQFGSRAIDFWNGFYNPADTTIKAEFDQGDNTHLNAAGHSIFFERVKAKNIFGPVGGPLPATFLKNTASYEKGMGIIKWSTTAETNVAAFEVQRSSDGNNFTALGKIMPHNNPANTYDYLFEDAQPAKGVNYYRIAILDIDGKIQYSPILKITTGSGKLQLNKITQQSNQLVLELQSNETQTAELQIMNSTGAFVYKQTKRIEAGTITVNMATTTLSKGVYYLRLISNKQEPVIKSFFKD